MTTTPQHPNPRVQMGPDPHPVFVLAALMVPCVLCGAQAGRPCVVVGPRAIHHGRPTDPHTPRRKSASEASHRALAELADQICPNCHSPVGDPNHGWHRCEPSAQLTWIRDELARMRMHLVEALGEGPATDLFDEVNARPIAVAESGSADASG